LKRWAKGARRNFAPISSIELSSRSRVRLDRLRRWAKGANRDLAPISLI